MELLQRFSAKLRRHGSERKLRKRAGRRGRGGSESLIVDPLEGRRLRPIRPARVRSRLESETPSPERRAAGLYSAHSSRSRLIQDPAPEQDDGDSDSQGLPLVTPPAAVSAAASAAGYGHRSSAEQDGEEDGHGVPLATPSTAVSTVASAAPKDQGKSEADEDDEKNDRGTPLVAPPVAALTAAGSSKTEIRKSSVGGGGDRAGHGVSLIARPTTSWTAATVARKDRRKSSADKSSDMRIQASGSTTPATTREGKLHSSFSVGSTLLGSELEVNRISCYICGQRMGKRRQFDDKTERVAYLPCGHAFGHECLFRWISDPSAAKKCPNCAVTLRHACEHHVLPDKSPPGAVFTDIDAAVMPWNYEFCKTPRGEKLHEAIDSAAARLRKAETDKRNRKKSAFDFGHEAMRRIHMLLVEQAEKKLDANQKAWWAVKWVEEFSTGPQPGTSFLKAPPVRAMLKDLDVHVGRKK